ncbi:MAG: malonyl-CoA decarboxylase [Alphaproteobacteria bacterium]
MSTWTSLLDTIVDRGRSLVGLKGNGRAETLDLIAATERLLGVRGEASGVALARDILARVDHAPTAERLAYLTTLADKFGADRARLDKAISAWKEHPDARAELEVHKAAEPRRQEVIRRLNLAPGGTAALVKLREHLLTQLPGRPDLAPLDADFVHLFSSWFNRGFLVIRRIDWTTPAHILEKIIAYEAVHEIKSWDDLRNRLQPRDRRCFAFFHPQLIDEPLVFVEVALSGAIPDAIAPLLDIHRRPGLPEEATTATFYSISNCQEGLRGISFGHFLIKQVVEELKKELPGLTTFVTLSPVPGFAAWLDGEIANSSALLGTPERAMLSGPQGSVDRTAATPALMTAAATYFLLARNSAGRPVDPVARFHLGNGARLERLNADGDLSDKGLRQSRGLMVNYLYDLEALEANHEAYAERAEVVASPAVKKLLRIEKAKPK